MEFFIRGCLTLVALAPCGGPSSALGTACCERFKVVISNGGTAIRTSSLVSRLLIFIEGIPTFFKRRENLVVCGRDFASEITVTRKCCCQMTFFLRFGVGICSSHH